MLCKTWIKEQCNHLQINYSLTTVLRGVRESHVEISFIQSLVSEWWTWAPLSFVNNWPFHSWYYHLSPINLRNVPNRCFLEHTTTYNLLLLLSSLKHVAASNSQKVNIYTNQCSVWAQTLNILMHCFQLCTCLKYLGRLPMVTGPIIFDAIISRQMIYSCILRWQSTFSCDTGLFFSCW